MGGERSRGQVYSSPEVVALVLDVAGYSGPEVLGKDAMEDSCGRGAFLAEMVRRYCAASLEERGSLPTADELRSRLHGIEIDPDNARACAEAMTEAAGSMGVEGPFEWDVACADALRECFGREGMYDFVVGNPPYVSNRNIPPEERDVLPRFRFAREGGPDLYILFFEAGLRMLRRGGVLAYITPSTYMHVSGGAEMRRRIRTRRECTDIVDVHRYDAFPDAQTSAVVTRMEKGVGHASVRIGSWSREGFGEAAEHPYAWLYLGDRMSLVADPERRRRFWAISSVDPSRYAGMVEAWSSLGTGFDKAFVDEKGEDLEDGPYVRMAYKARRGTWCRCICPYTPSGEVARFEDLPEGARARLLRYRDRLEARSSVSGRGRKWYEWQSRSEAEHSLRERVAVSNLVTDLSSVRAQVVPAGCVVYGSPSIATTERHPAGEILAALRSQDFVDYVQDLHKIKGEGPTADGRGTKYEYTVEDLLRYLCYTLEDGKL